MLTTKRKLRDRKQFFLKVYILAALIVLGLVGGYVTSLKLFTKHGYLSPLVGVLSQESNQEDAIAAIKEKLTAQKIEVVSITMEDEKYKVVLKNDSEVIFSSKKDINTQISSLQFIMSRLTMEGRRFSRLDLTFDKPVIVLEK
jgi:hypothetical protein